jgi:hypothetical protein
MATINLSTASQKAEFQARLARIETGTGSSKSTLFVGVDESYLVSNKTNAKLQKRATTEPPKPLGLFGIFVAVVLGLLSLGMAVYLQFTMTGDASPLDNSDVTLAINGGLGLTIAVFGGYMLKMPLMKFLPLSAMGVLAGLVSFHNLVHFYPAQFAEMFSPTFVEQVITATDANSIIWRGKSFVL